MLSFPTQKPNLTNLSSELFTSILTYIPSQRDLSSLSRTSHALYHLTIPSLYKTWSYHGLASNPRDSQPLRKFLETINWRPDLGEYVKVLDLREWGQCPRLEEWVGFFWKGQEARDMAKSEMEMEMKRGTVGEEGGMWEMDDDGGEWVEGGNQCIDEVMDFDNGTDSMSESMDTSSDEEFKEYENIQPSELEFLGPLVPERDEKVDAMYLRAGRLMGFEKVETVLTYANILFEEDEDELIILLVSSLPNLQKLYMVLPETWEPEHNVLHRFLENTSKLAAFNVLQQLETLYICSALFLGGKDHREYYLNLKRIIPFMRLPKLRQLYTLTAHRYDDPANFPPLNYSPLQKSSDLTTLVYDEAELPPQDAIASLQIPKALKCFRWTGEIRCFSIGSCYAPFQSSLGVALATHKNTLEDLYLDVRHWFCNGDGHHANPFTTLDTVRRVYSDDMAEKWARNRGPKSAVMLGSLRDFKMLKKLAINVTLLVGHQDWAAADEDMASLLPSSLEDLTLFTDIAPHIEGDMILENHLWYPQLLDLIRIASFGDRLTKLKTLKLIAITRQLINDDEKSEHPLFSCKGMFLDMERMCRDVGITLIVERAALRGNTDIPYFLEQTKDRNPGRDF